MRRTNFGPRILLLLREARVTNCSELIKVLWDRTEATMSWPRHLGDLRMYTDGAELLNSLSELAGAGLIGIEGCEPSTIKAAPIDASITLSPDWMAIQRALGFSLRELASAKPDSMLVSPFHGMASRESLRQYFDLFVLMPFSDDLEPVYEDHIKGVARSLKLDVRRADDFFSAHHVVQDIWNAIVASRCVIADCTGRNPNVFYEIGLAHAVGRPVILITQDSDDVPFDLRHVRFLHYEYTPRGMKSFEEALSKTITWSLQEDILKYS